MTKLRAALVLAAVAIVLVISTRASSDNTVPATGVWNAAVQIEWCEVTAY